MIKLTFDNAVFLCFLLSNIVLGLASSRGVRTIKDYALGDRNFSTATIVATIVATWVSGEFFFTNLYETYTNGLNFIWTAVLGDFLSILLVGLVFVPRMSEFLGTLSIAEAMGNLFGTRVRVITSVAGFIGSCGLIAIQLKMAGFIFEYAFDLPGIYGILIASVIVTLYSALGGVKSVTFTDVIQFLTFSVVIPIIAYALLSSVDDLETIQQTVSSSPLFDYKKVFDFSEASSCYYLFIFLFFVIPAFTPAVFQRISMARNVAQASKSFVISAFICMLLVVMVDWIGVLALSIDPDLAPSDVAKKIIFESNYVGLRGAALVGIMAMIMSTVDSYINATSVLIVHDFLKPLNINFSKDELISARATSIIIGVISFILSVRDKGLLDLMIVTYSFYLPVVTVPFIMAVLGFRSTEKSVLCGMVAGLGSVLLWDYVFKIQMVNSIPIGVIINLAVMMGVHYIFKQSGGWIGIKGSNELDVIREKRANYFSEICDNIKNFSFLDSCKRNYPKGGEGMIALLGIFVMTVTFSSINNLAMNHDNKFISLLDILYPITLCSCSALMSYPLWLQKWKETKFIAVIWNIIMFSVLICFSFLTVLISNFADIQLIVFMMNIVIIFALTKWHWALLHLVIGCSFTAFAFYYYADPLIYSDSASSLQFKTVYLMILASGSVILFLKPKEEYIEETEHKAAHYSVRVADQEKEIERLNATAQKILNNVNHELRLPIGNVINFADMLQESLAKSDDILVKELAVEVYKNSTRVSSMILNMLDLAMLDAGKIQLNTVLLNFSELVKDRAQKCFALYAKAKDLQLKLCIERDIMLSVDPNYMRQVIDNLVINAINFSAYGAINIKLSRTQLGEVECVVTDEGIGIAKEDLSNIFAAFKMGSKTESKAHGRGVGLALCKAAVEAHGGEISAYSNGIKGAQLKFILKEGLN